MFRWFYLRFPVILEPSADSRHSFQSNQVLRVAFVSLLNILFKIKKIYFSSSSLANCTLNVLSGTCHVDCDGVVQIEPMFDITTVGVKTIEYFKENARENVYIIMNEVTIQRSLKDLQKLARNMVTLWWSLI